MPFFSRRTEPEDEAIPVQQHQPVQEQPKRSGLFGSHRRSPSPTPTASTNGTRYTSTTYHTSPGSQDTGSGGLFRRSTDAGAGSRSSRGGSLLHKFGGSGDHVEMDPSIVQARERVMRAEAAEREADRALEISRREVREAREQVRALELEAKEEARRAKIKQYHAKEVSKRGKALGRHDHV
ncbi:hypothetical protein NKR23_g2094 [Pleurostoma richardsiae]|uniref:Uncharacterized protein n=1 Tax=Pleurostoma richardsiae TaxID=41990 RepID=A0AA38RRA7_9PEZI|nr:hypothetical protein NKR23_g2094 [Pleurostoma richardsiae]